MAELQASYVNGLAPTPLRYQTVGQALAGAAEQWPEREAIIVHQQGRALTWAELHQRAEQLAANLLELGLEPGDRVGIWSPNCLEWVLVQFATGMAGLVLVNINPAYRADELAYALNKVECSALIFAERFKDSDYAGMLAQLLPELAQSTPGALRSYAAPNLHTLVAIADRALPGCLQFADLDTSPTDSGRARLRSAQSVQSPDDAINIQFTSGTTGSPKGATLSHMSILNNGRYVGEAMRLSADDRICIPVPLYHCFGMVMGVLACVAHGATMVFPSEVFEPEITLQAVAAYGCTALYGVPTMFIAMLEANAQLGCDVSTLRTGIMAGAPCPLEVMNRVIADLGVAEITIAYGMTETSPVSFQSSIEDSVERRVSTVGRVHPHVQVKIIDKQGVVVAPGEQGELCTRGYSVMRGYWNDPEITAEAVDEAGWMRTGDLATMDEQGFVRITGRLKDMVIRGGENLYPLEIEELLYRHPAIQDVQVVGVPDQKYGEELCAWIVLQTDTALREEQLREYCREHMARHKIPRYIRFVSDYPMTITGKIQKFKIREAMCEELGITQ